MSRIFILLLLTQPAHAWYVTPRLGVGLAIGDTGDEWRPTNVPLSAGVALQPSGSQLVAGFVSPQLDVEFPTVGEGVSYVPTLRLGILVRDEKPEYFSALLPWLQVYLILGYRLPDGPLDPGSRVGIGLSSPIGLVVSLRALEAGVPIPNTVEVVIDGVETTDALALLRLGFTL